MSNGNGPLNPVGNGNGRGDGGKFAKGNKVARGNPNNARAQRLRNAAVRAVTRGDVTAILKKMIELAKAGDAVAAKLILDRALGKVSNADVLERVEQLEQVIAERGGRWN